MPIYVALDSADVWSEPQFFQLDENNLPTEVAGCPPDAFTEDGQLWGNPLYDWDRMKAEIQVVLIIQVVRVAIPMLIRLKR